MSTKNVALGLLASKVDRGELEISEAIDRAIEIAFNLRKKDEDEEEPPTVRYPKIRAYYQNK